MQDTILGLDIGTTSTKAVLFDLSGVELATAEQGYSLSTPQAGWVEQDPEAVWQALVKILQTIVAKAGPERRILALALAAQSGSVIPADEAGEPLYPMITWMDGRTENLVKQWQAQGLGPLVRQASGWQLRPGAPLLTLPWLRQFMPNLFASTRRYLSVSDFLIRRLTGEFCIDLSTAAEALLLDIKTGEWSISLCKLAGISPDQLSPVKPSGLVVGTINAPTSRLTGLSPDILVVNGGHDQCCTPLALGMLSPGKMMLATGTAWVIAGVTESPSLEAIPTLMDLNYHVVPQRWIVSQLLGGFGASVEWWLRHGWQNITSPLSRAEQYQTFNEAVAQSQPGSKRLLFLPPGSGAQLGTLSPQGGFIGLRLDHSRAEMGRAILEGAAFELRWALENIREAGMAVAELAVVGGATYSPVWSQILADVSGQPLSIPQETHWPALGAAILAGVGAGVFESMEAGQVRFQRPGRELAPDSTQQALYEVQFLTYKQLAGKIYKA